MASIIYDSFMPNMFNGVFAGATFKAMLVNDQYNPSQSQDQFRSVPAAFEVTGASGYTAGGQVVAVTASYNAGLAQYQLTFANPTWASASITARGAVLYHARGGSAAADELVAYADFGMDVTSTNSTFTAIFSTPLVLQNLS